MVEEYSRLSLLANGRVQLPALVPGNEASELHDLRTLGAGNHDFSVLVELHWSHQTQHVAKGVHTCDSAGTNKPGKSIRCKLI